MKEQLIAKCYEPSGLVFYDRGTGRRAMLVDAGEPRKELVGWLLYWSEEYGNWVTWRKADDADILKLA